MPNPAKASQREKEIDAARYKGNWNVIPELARKYRKHNPAGIVLEQTVLAELALVQVIDKEQIKNFNPENYYSDTSSKISIKPPIEESLIKDVFNKLEMALSEAKGQDKVYTSIVLARAYFSIGRYDKCVATLGTDFMHQKSPVGYNYILTIQGLTLKGISQEILGDLDDAITCYDQVVVLLSQFSGERSEQLSTWSEIALYHNALLKVNLSDVSSALQAFRTYQHYAATWGDKFQLHKRANIFRHFNKFLSKTYQEGTYVPPRNISPSISTNVQSTIFTPHTFRVEINGLHLSYEKVLDQITRFPKAGEINWKVLEFIDQVMSDWILLNGGTAAEIKNLIEMLYRATQKTFQSPRILRHLINSLITLGDYDEAELAVNAYIALVEKAKETNKSDVVKRMSSSGLNKLTEKFIDVESNQDFMQVLITSAELMAKQLDKKTLELANKAIKLIENIGVGLSKELIAKAWRFVGVGYSMLADKEYDPKSRPEFHAKAIDALNKSIKLDPEAFETYYQLALEYAITRDIGQAIESVKQALALDGTNIPCWHLLVLLLSSQKDIQGALKASEIGAKESDWETTDSTVDFNTLAAIGNNDGEEFLSFKLTQNVLQELANGSETAIQNFDKLFTLFGRVFPDYSLVSYYDSSSKKHEKYEDTISSKLQISSNSAKSFTSSSDKKEEYLSSSNNNDGSTISSATNKETLDVPKTNYATSIASSSKNSGSSGVRPSPTPTITDLWLGSASIFRRLGNLEEAQKAIESAEEIDNMNPDIWYQLGLLHFVQEQYVEAISAFHKAMALDLNHVLSLVYLARTYIETKNIEIAEGILDDITKGIGWDCAEAWLYLGQIYKATNRIKRTKDCLWYTLDLEESQPIRSFNVLPRCL
ncbi:10956_t:CDS:10 [Entrophospora sp. SA101]|nr:10956_t:CDS:10 [Entrophospora sp. SA101]CAJ0910012.1 16578_t:CDS:10 [Entrophospora sp. SA101]